MNRYARIMQAVGWLATLLWLGAWLQGRGVAPEGPTLARHTILALGAAATTLLSRGWSAVFLALRGEQLATPAAKRARLLALALATLAVAVLAMHFALSGSLLWERIRPATHALLGAALIATHVAALLAERAALRLAGPLPSSPPAG